MSNPLTITVNKIIPRHDPENQFMEIEIEDNEDRHAILEMNPPADHKELLDLIVKESVGWNDLFDTLDFHFKHSSGLNIE